MPLANILVSVIIPTYNRESLVLRAIRSVIAQSYENWELIIIDDGSSDRTSKVIQDFLTNWHGSQKIHTLTTDNHGVSYARNRGAEVATGDWLAFLDSDDEWLPNKLALQIPLTEKHSFVHSEEIWQRGDVVVKKLAKHTKGGGQIFAQCVEICCISPSTVLMSRALFEQQLGFREDFTVCEDYELWLRITARQEVGFVAEPSIIKHGGRQDQLSVRYHSMDYFRVKALVPFLVDQNLTAAQRLLVAESICKRCEYLIKGYNKHANDLHRTEVEAWQTTAQNFNK